MSRWSAVIVAFAIAALATGPLDAASKPGGGKDSVAYKWVDENGVVHYGDHVPPEYSKSERTVLSDQGVEIRRLEAEKTPEQRAAESQRTRSAEQRKQHDQFLLTTYSSVSDIESLRDQRLEQIGGQSTAADQYVETLNTRLSGLQARAQLFKPYNGGAGARRMPDDLAADLVRTVSELRAQNNVLNAKRQELDGVARQFQADIERFAELQAGRRER